MGRRPPACAKHASRAVPLGAALHHVSVLPCHTPLTLPLCYGQPRNIFHCLPPPDPGDTPHPPLLLWGGCIRGAGTQKPALAARETVAGHGLGALEGGEGGRRDALEGKGPQRRPQQRLDRRLEEVAKAVGGGYCRVQMRLKLALGVRETVAGCRLGGLGRLGATLPMHPCPRRGWGGFGYPATGPGRPGMGPSATRQRAADGTPLPNTSAAQRGSEISRHAPWLQGASTAPQSQVRPPAQPREAPGSPSDSAVLNAKKKRKTAGLRCARTSASATRTNNCNRSSANWRQSATNCRRSSANRRRASTDAGWPSTAVDSAPSTAAGPPTRAVLREKNQRQKPPAVALRTAVTNSRWRPPNDQQKGQPQLKVPRPDEGPRGTL